MSAAASASSHSVGAEFETDSEKSQRSQTVNQEEIARLAYALWQSRGCPDGSPEQDWFAAEEKIRASYELPTGELPTVELPAGEAAADHQLPEKLRPSLERHLLSPRTEAERIA